MPDAPRPKPDPRDGASCRASATLRRRSHPRATDPGSRFAPEKGLRVCLAGIAVGAQAGVADRNLVDLCQATLLLGLVWDALGLLQPVGAVLVPI
jgi:hypothetical protein